MVRALAWSAGYWIAAALPFTLFHWGIGIGTGTLGFAALAGVGPATVFVTWLYLRPVGTPRRPASLLFTLALALIHPPADYAFLSRFAPELLWNHLFGWKGVVFYVALGAAPLLTAWCGDSCNRNPRAASPRTDPPPSPLPQEESPRAPERS